MSKIFSPDPGWILVVFQIRQSFWLRNTVPSEFGFFLRIPLGLDNENNMLDSPVSGWRRQTDSWHHAISFESWGRHKVFLLQSGLQFGVSALRFLIRMMARCSHPSSDDFFCFIVNRGRPVIYSCQVDDDMITQEALSCLLKPAMGATTLLYRYCIVLR
jgi:hypothetical protein